MEYMYLCCYSHLKKWEIKWLEKAQQLVSGLGGIQIQLLNPHNTVTCLVPSPTKHAAYVPFMPNHSLFPKCVLSFHTFMLLLLYVLSLFFLIYFYQLEANYFTIL